MLLISIVCLVWEHYLMNILPLKSFGWTNTRLFCDPPLPSPGSPQGGKGLADDMQTERFK